MGNTIITVAGKGGVGKTSISAALVRQLVKNHPEARILAIDADPAVGLSTALDVKADLTVDDIRKEIAEAGQEDREKKKALALLSEARFRIVEAMTEKDGFTFLAVGRPETAGCYCGVNSFLKEIISMFSEEFDYVVIDGEAGIEQINRRVMEKVSHLLLVTDPSRKGTQVIKTIKNVADELVMYKKIGVIVNRINDKSIAQELDLGQLPVLAYIPDDSQLALFDLKGKSIMELPDSSELITGVQKAIEISGII